MGRGNPPTKTIKIMTNRGGARPNAGRKKIEGGKRRFLTIPPDIEDWAQIHGTAWIWEQVRLSVANNREAN